jgi:hypothetical protein
VTGEPARPSCAADSRACGESPNGTASRARRWVLVEQPGAWGSDALTSSDLPPAVAVRLQELAATLPARVLLLRRPGGVTRGGTERAVYAGASTPAGGWLERIEVDHVDRILDLDLRGVRDGATGTVGGDRLVDPLYLVCTNGKHDPCCAEYGLPVARALDDLVPGRVWECSHVGGDRFAGNLVCLPDGVLYGHLDPDQARAALTAHEGGRVLLDRWRGRSALAFPAQAAEALVRRRLGLERLPVLHVTRHEAHGARHEVELQHGDERLLAVVEVTRDPTPRALTCGGVPSLAPRYELRELHTLPA